MNTVLFVSSNITWGGSEILWSESAAVFLKEGLHVSFGVKYSAPIIQKLIGEGASYINLNNDYSFRPLVHRLFIKGRRTIFGFKEPFLKAVSANRPSLVIISQGNNIDGNYYMNICRELNIPFVTVTQLVTNMLLTFIDDSLINQLRANYAAALANYFVSADNLALHNTMMGEELPNSVITGNPFTVPADVSMAYPQYPDNLYKVAIVGRLEIYHKGHDILFEILKQEKWKKRNVQFSVYGSGPHKELAERLVKKHSLKNVFFKGQVANVAEIWKENQFLIMPSRMEGQSLALIEAMWCKRGAVVTDIGDAKKLIGNNAGFVSAFPAVADFDRAMEAAWEKRNEWEMIGIRAGDNIRKIYTEHPVTSFVNKLKAVLKFARQD